jgi:NTE family protein
MQAIDIMYNKMAVLQLKNADVVIKPKVGHIGSSDFSKRHEAIIEGEKAAAGAHARHQPGSRPAAPGRPA